MQVARGSLDRFIDKIVDDHMANTKAEDASDRDMVDEMLVFLDEAGTGDATRGGEKDDLLLSNFRLTRNNIKAIIMVSVPSSKN